MNNQINFKGGFDLASKLGTYEKSLIKEIRKVSEKIKKLCNYEQRPFKVQDTRHEKSKALAKWLDA